MLEKILSPQMSQFKKKKKKKILVIHFIDNRKDRSRKDVRCIF